MVKMCAAIPPDITKDVSLLTSYRQILQNLANYDRLLKWSGKPQGQEVVPGSTWQVPADIDVLPPDSGISDGDCLPHSLYQSVN